MAIYVTVNGFQKKTLAEIKLELEEQFRSVFGETIDVEPEGPFGQIIGILSQRDANLWDALEEIYKSRDPDQATGTSLTSIARESGTTRNPAVPSTVQAILYGTESTIVPENSKSRRNTDRGSNPILFNLDNDIEINRTRTKELILTIPTDPTPTEVFSVTIESIVYSHTVPGGGNTKDEVIDAIVSQIDPLDDVISENRSTTLYIFSIPTSLNISNTANFQIDTLGSSGNFTADESGPIQVPANTLTEIVTPITGWEGLNNPSSGVTGNVEETDFALRLRRIQELSTGLSTVASIRKEVNSVENVLVVVVETNRTNITDVDGRPPHSFEVVVSGGDDNDIAQAIFDSAPAGIEWYGVGSSGTAIDELGNSFTILFSRPTPVYIWIRISRDLNPEEAYPTDGDNLIKENILEYVSENITIGTDIIRQRLATPVYEVPGVGDIIIELAETASPGDTPVYAEDSIILAGRDQGVFALSRITVQDIP